MGAGGGALLLTAANLLSYMAGLTRDLVLANRFGASAETDAFFAGFLIPDFIFNFLVLGFVSGALLPIFLQTEQKSAPKAVAIFQSFLTLVVIISTMVAAIAFFLAPLLIGLFFGEKAGGIPRTAAELDLILQITRILLLSPIIFGVSNTIGMILLAKKRFFSMAISPLLYNVGIISGILLLGESMGIAGAAWGAVAGALLHLFSRAFDFPATRISIWPRINFSPELKTIFLLGVPKTLGFIAFQLVLFIFTVLAARLDTGSLSAWNYARNIQSLPVSLFGIAFATAALPFLSDYAGRGDAGRFRHRLHKTLAQILFFTIPAASGLMLIATATVTVLFAHGQFDAQAVALTVGVLFFLAVSIPFEALTHLLARAYLAKQNTLLPAYAKLLFLGIAAGCAWSLAPQIGVAAFGIAFSAAAMGEAAYLIWFLPESREIPVESLRSLRKIVLATAIMSLGMYGFLRATETWVMPLQLFGALVLAAMLYFGSAIVLRIPEVSEIFLFQKATNGKLPPDKSLS